MVIARHGGDGCWRICYSSYSTVVRRDGMIGYAARWALLLTLLRLLPAARPIARSFDSKAQPAARETLRLCPPVQGSLTRVILRRLV
jgi:hypothetical protein